MNELKLMKGNEALPKLQFVPDVMDISDILLHHNRKYLEYFEARSPYRKGSCFTGRK